MNSFVVKFRYVIDLLNFFVFVFDVMLRDVFLCLNCEYADSIRLSSRRGLSIRSQAQLLRDCLSHGALSTMNIGLPSQYFKTSRINKYDLASIDVYCGVNSVL